MKKELSKKQLIKASKEYIKLWEYIIDLPNGSTVEYAEIEKTLGIKMTAANKAKLHKACVNSGREYSLIRQIGYRLADGETALGVVHNRINSVGNSLTRLKRTHINIKVDIYEEMSPEDKQRFNFTESLTNAISNSLDNSRRLKELGKLKKLSDGKPELPQDVT